MQPLPKCKMSSINEFSEMHSISHSIISGEVLVVVQQIVTVDCIRSG